MSIALQIFERAGVAAGATCPVVVNHHPDGQQYSTRSQQAIERLEAMPRCYALKMCDELTYLSSHAPFYTKHLMNFSKCWLPLAVQLVGRDMARLARKFAVWVVCDLLVAHLFIICTLKVRRYL